MACFIVTVRVEEHREIRTVEADSEEDAMHIADELPDVDMALSCFEENVQNV